MRIVIIGGGPGGYEAALVAAEQGADVTVVSRDGLGGNSVLNDCVPSKAMIVSAQAMGWMQSADRLGVRLEDGSHVGERTVVDLGAVMRRVQFLGMEQSADIERKVLDSGAKVLRGSARLAGSVVVEVIDALGTTQALPADAVLVATGSAPRILPFARPDSVRVFTCRELFALERLPERLVVVGSGVTGAEYAQCFAKYGSDVHLISSREQILPNEDSDAATVIERSFERWGMTIHRRSRAVDQEVGADGVRVKITTPDGQTWVEGTHALWCVGQTPASRNLGLEAAGVVIEEGGAVDVDAVSRTNVRTIYAAGDVTGGIMLASVAAMRGRIAMWHALGMPVAPLRRDDIAYNVFTSPQVATVGIDAAGAAAAQIPIDSLVLQLAGNPRAKMDEATEGFVKIHALRGSGTVVGGAIVAANACDLIGPLSVAVHNRLTVGQLAQAFTIYPSVSGSTAEAARQIAARQDRLGILDDN